MPAGSARTKHGGRATAAARGLFTFLDKNPVGKLLGVLAVSLASLVSLMLQVDSCRQQRVERQQRQAERQEEAERGGYAYPPKADLLLTGFGECHLSNLDARPIREATLRWRHYLVMLNPCSVPVHTSLGEDGARAVVEPRGRLTVSLGADGPVELCADMAQAQRYCDVGGDCRIAIECAATYHRDADLGRFTASRYAFVKPGCRLLEPGPPFQAGGEDESAEEAALQRQAWECLARTRPAIDDFMAQARSRFRGQADPLASRDW